MEEKKEMEAADISCLYDSIKAILSNARQQAYRAVNFAMVKSYWLVGQRIVEHEQHGEARADYGKRVLKELAKRLTNDLGKGFDERELRKMRQFYLAYPKWDTVRPELTWSHYRRLISVENEQVRQWYMTEAADNMWSTEIWEFRTLYNGIAYRLFAFWDREEETLVIATHGIIKKTQKTPSKEIAKAERIRKEYFETKGK